MRLALLILLLPFACFAQHPLVTGAGIDWTRASSATMAPLLSLMPNLAEAWEFTNLTTNVTVTSWVGVYGTIRTNGASASRPTNSASGVGFASGTFLTNVPVSIGTNYVVAEFIKVTDWSGDYANEIVAMEALSTGNFKLGYFNGASGHEVPEWRLNSGLNFTLGSLFFVDNIFLDLVYCLSNNANGTGAFYVYTNGQFMGTSTSVESVSESSSENGFRGGTGWFTGFEQGSYLSTNVVATTFPAYCSNIHYYRTNFLTKGASP